ncbi:DMT family transporter [Rhodobacteraceae bacterium CCMM004]|nr:DMT family transporter [Rhodobacteraceae bacterium CCMM004]
MNPVRGIFLILVAVTLFTLMSAFVKALPRVPAGEAVFFRSIFAMPVVFAWLWWQGKLKGGLKTQNWRGHAVRGIAGTGAMMLGFVGLTYLPLAEVTAIRFVTPVFILIFAAVILGERFARVRAGAVALGLIGVGVIVWPRLTLSALGGPEAFGVAMTLGSALLAGLAQVFIKSMSGTERVAAIVFYFSLTSALLSLATLPFGWVWPTPVEAAMLVTMGLIGGLGQILLTSAYRHADAGALAPFTYVSMLWAVIFGFVWFGEVPSWATLGGAALVITAGIVITLRERALGREATARRKVRAKGMM